MTKKYKLGEQNPHTNLYRVVALKDFPDVKKGDVGGWVASEQNLSQEQWSWVSGEAMVWGNARVFGNSWVSDAAKVYGNAKVFSNAVISGDARVYEAARICGNATVFGEVWISGTAWVHGNARVYGAAKLDEDAWVFDFARVFGTARLSGEARVAGNSIVSGDSWERSPLQIRGTQGCLTTSSFTEVSIDCEKHTIGYWLDNYNLILRSYRYSDEEIEEYHQMLLFCKTWLSLQNFNQK